MAINSGLVTYPTGFAIAWSGAGLTLWRPKPQKGYVALGCIADQGVEPPSLTTVVCLHESVGVEAALGQCLSIKDQSSGMGTCTLVVCLKLTTMVRLDKSVGAEAALGSVSPSKTT